MIVDSLNLPILLIRNTADLTKQFFYDKIPSVNLVSSFREEPGPAWKRYNKNLHNWGSRNCQKKWAHNFCLACKSRYWSKQGRSWRIPTKVQHHQTTGHMEAPVRQCSNQVNIWAQLRKVLKITPEGQKDQLLVDRAVNQNFKSRDLNTTWYMDIRVFGTVQG